ncbi:MAG: UDP-N-acetylmuramoyl-L-alanine--D-glutamate ligase [Candidatus Omnitrophica bacterium]|nr:UDP-N-acetylmuramoyl-L-alanine--D-glutamate ligase [Candidatus Omnitrophota bacterium]
MRNPGYFKDKSVTVVGLARSGLACANLLFDLGARVRISDNQDNEAIRRNIARLKSKSIASEVGGHTRDFIRGADLLIVSPGVANNSPVIARAEEESIPVISEIEFAWMLCPAEVIAVTGSTGKTTVTTLIGEVLKTGGRRAYVCGNIGTPFAQEVPKMQTGDYAVLEASSFQLERIAAFKPKIALMLNFNRNHLDRHKDMQEYLEAKMRIFMNQDAADYLVLNERDPALKGLSRQARSKVVYFSENASFNPNQAAVASVAGIIGIDSGICRKVFADFKGLKHRMEYVATLNDVKFVNDSKATVAESTAWAIKNIPSGVVLIAGGRDKGVDYSMILGAAGKKVKYAVLIGEAKDKIRRALSGALPLEDAEDMQAAVSRAYSLASPGDTVLLSPMCSSFDMFSDYEERGEAFRQAVLALADSVSKR